MLKISSDCHIKIGQTAKQRVILKIPVPFFRETYGLFVGIKIKHQRCDSPIKNSVLNLDLGARDILLRHLLLRRLQYCNFFYLSISINYSVPIQTLFSSSSFIKTPMPNVSIAALILFQRSIF